MKSTTFPMPSRPVPPRLALVIGSGGVRGVAAIGVVEVLAGAGLHVDLIAGCSSGALFGAGLSLGLPCTEVLAMAKRLWSADLTEQRRWKSYAQMLLPRWTGFDEGFSLRDDRRIVERLVQAFGDRRLESLPTRLRVAATDAASGEPVLLTEGRVVDAVRASMALPFVFPSVEWQGRRLVDGVISDPLPIDAARDANAVVAIGFAGAMPRRVDRASRLIGQATTALTNNLLRARIAAARATRQQLVCLELELERRVGLWDTAAMPYLYEAGRRAAHARLGAIQAMCEGPRWPSAA